MKEDQFLKLLQKELVVALGCTEPIAIALAASHAANYAHGKEITSIKVYASTNIIKNAMSVTIPGTNMCGVNFAASLGAIREHGKKNLEVLSGLSNEEIKNAKKIVTENKVSVFVAKDCPKLYIDVTVNKGESYGRAIIENTHTNVSYIESDGKIISTNKEEKSEKKEDDCSQNLDISSILNFAENVDLNKLELIKKSIELNRKIAAEGIKNEYGLQVGKTIMDNIEKGILSNDMPNYAMALTSGASDARMAGCSLSVMSNSGSGNQGITATIPVVAVYEKLNLPKEKLIRAVTLSNLITIYIKMKFGRLSALCGATVAATGASCGITYLCGGKEKEIKSTIQNMLGNVTGMLCDGAKAGCALKVSTCTNAAIQSAMLALKNITINASNGIIENDVENTINNVSILAGKGTQEADNIILNIMINKKIV